MMGLTQGTLVRALFPFDLKNPLVMLTILLVVLTTLLVVFVAWGLAFLSRQELSQLLKLFCWSCLYPKGVEYKGSQLIEIFWRPNP